MINAKNKYGDIYVLITEKESPYVTKQTILDLIDKNQIVLTKKSQEILKKYKH